MPSQRLLIVFGLATLLSTGCRIGTSKDPGSEPGESKPAPETYEVKFETSKGDVIVEVRREWAPKGADRFYQLVKAGFYGECRFFRVMPNFIVQWGINGDPSVQKEWQSRIILDDDVVQSNKRGTITFAKTDKPNSRTTHVFINLKDNAELDSQKFAPFGKVIQGMDVVDKITAQYGQQPRQDLIERDGNAYLKQNFPNLDFIKKATVISESKPNEKTPPPINGKTKTDSAKKSPKTS